VVLSLCGISICELELSPCLVKVAIFITLCEVFLRNTWLRVLP
jgi:hypothetical protein